MTTKKLFAVDFREQQSVSQVLTTPIEHLSSRDQPWNDLHFEYHYHDSHETPEHHPVEHVVAIQTTGEVQAERRLNGQLKQEEIRPGDVCLVPAYTSHWIHSVGKQGLIFLSLDPAFLKRVAYDASGSERVALVPQFAKPDPLVSQIGLSLKHALQTNPNGSQFYAESLSIALAAHLLRNYAAYNLPSITHGSLPAAKIQRAMDYINSALSTKLSLKVIAETVGMSQYHFCRSFKQVTGMTPWQYVVQQRINAAKQLLKKPHLSVVEASRLLGFSTQSQFTTFFRRHTGTSPTAYRKSL